MRIIIGKTQTPDIDRALESAKEELLKKRDVTIRVVHFLGIKTKEHPQEYEYEVYTEYEVCAGEK